MYAKFKMVSVGLGCRSVCKLEAKMSLAVRQKLKPAVELVEATAGETGLNEADIEALVDVAACGKLGKLFLSFFVDACRFCPAEARAV